MKGRGFEGGERSQTKTRECWMRLLAFLCQRTRAARQRRVESNFSCKGYYLDAIYEVPD